MVPAGAARRQRPPGSQAARLQVHRQLRIPPLPAPDDAIHRGLDKQTEADLARPDNFISNFEPLTSEQARERVERVTEFEKFTAADAAAAAGRRPRPARATSSAPPIRGWWTASRAKNPRYLQIRPDLVDPMNRYVAERGMRGSRADPGEPVPTPVTACCWAAATTRPTRGGIRRLAVYNPIHYQELPELFMDFICSLTGKSPSTTGAGCEGALTKGPFNALRPITDLNNALVSYILTGLAGFSTAAGYIGPNDARRSRHQPAGPGDLVPADARERDPAFLIREGHLEPLEDFDHEGQPILASRLGYRITAKFVRTFFGRVFDNPARVFDEAIPAARDPGPGRVRRRRPQHHRSPPARRAASTSRTARSRTPAPRCGPCSRSWQRAHSRAKTPSTRTSVGCSASTPSWPAIGTGKDSSPSTGRRAALEASPGLPRRPLGRASPRVARRVGRAVPPPRIRLGRAGAHQVPGLPRRIERRARPRSRPPAAGLSLRGSRLRSSVLGSDGTENSL